MCLLIYFKILSFKFNYSHFITVIIETSIVFEIQAYFKLNPFS